MRRSPLELPAERSAIALLLFVLFFSAVPSAAGAQSSRGITVRIETELSGEQGQEFVFVTLWNEMHLIVLDAETPAGSADFTLPEPGTYLCFIHALTDLPIDGERQNVLGHGALQLTLNGGEVFSLTGDFSKFEERGAFLIGLEQTGTITGAGGSRFQGDDPRERDTPRGNDRLDGLPFLPR